MAALPIGGSSSSGVGYSDKLQVKELSKLLAERLVKEGLYPGSTAWPISSGQRLLSVWKSSAIVLDTTHQGFVTVDLKTGELRNRLPLPGGAPLHVILPTARGAAWVEQDHEGRSLKKITVYDVEGVEGAHSKAEIPAISIEHLTLEVDPDDSEWICCSGEGQHLPLLSGRTGGLIRLLHADVGTRFLCLRLETKGYALALTHTDPLGSWIFCRYTLATGLSTPFFRTTTPITAFGCCESRILIAQNPISTNSTSEVVMLDPSGKHLSVVILYAGWSAREHPSFEDAGPIKRIKPLTESHFMLVDSFSIRLFNVCTGECLFYTPLAKGEDGEIYPFFLSSKEIGIWSTVNGAHFVGRERPDLFHLSVLVSKCPPYFRTYEPLLQYEGFLERWKSPS